MSRNSVGRIGLPVRSRPIPREVAAIMDEEGVYCVEEGCPSLATHEILKGVSSSGFRSYELVCEEHIPNS